uniref:Uncharacterized protein n=1 Tax=Anguilla anguilla TaxID=7936 RepID=A0A0E9TPP0_ANGAN
MARGVESDSDQSRFWSLEGSLKFRSRKRNCQAFLCV